MFIFTSHIMSRFLVFSFWLQITCGGLATLPAPLLAQKPVKGNRQLVTQMRSVDRFTSLAVKGSWANVTVECGGMPLVEVTTDANVAKYIRTNASGGTLTIDTDRWIQPSQLKIRVQVPFVQQVSVEGWVKVDVNGLQGGRLALFGETGTLTLAGRLDSLMISGGQLMVNAKDLAVPQINAKIGFGGTVVHQDQTKLSATGEGIAYTAAAYEKRELVKPEVVSFTLYNPSNRRMQIYVRGPRERSFSYGFPLGAFAKRSENWPVGTRIYTSPLGGGTLGKLLYEVTPATAGQLIRLDR